VKAEYIILRGHNRQIIFGDDEDKEKFLQTLKKCKEKSKYNIYGYCLVKSHIHMLLHAQEEDMGLIMRHIGASLCILV